MIGTDNLRHDLVSWFASKTGIICKRLVISILLKTIFLGHPYLGPLGDPDKSGRVREQRFAPPTRLEPSENRESCDSDRNCSVSERNFVILGLRGGKAQRRQCSHARFGENVVRDQLKRAQEDHTHPMTVPSGSVLFIFKNENHTVPILTTLRGLTAELLGGELDIESMPLNKARIQYC